MESRDDRPWDNFKSVFTLRFGTFQTPSATGFRGRFQLNPLLPRDTPSLEYLHWTGEANRGADGNRHV